MVRGRDRKHLAGGRAGAPSPPSSFFFSARRLRTLALAGGVALAGAGVLAWWNVRHGPAVNSSAAQAAVLVRSAALGHQHVAFVILIMGVVIAAGCHLKAGSRPRAEAAASMKGWLALALAALGGGMLIWQAGVSPLVADIPAQQGLAYQGQTRRHALAAALFRQAVESNPRPFMYRGMFSEASLAQFEQTAGSGVAARMLEEPERVLEAGRRDMSCNRKDYYLGRTLLHHALHEAEPRRKELALRAAQHFAIACALEPHAEPFWTDAALVDELLLGDAKAAEGKRARARQAASKAWLPWAEFQFRRSFSCSDPGMKTRLLATALEYFDAAVREEAAVPAVKARAHIGRAMLLLGSNRAREAAPVLEQAVKEQLPFDTWEAEMLLAECWLHLADRAKAREHLQKSLSAAPADKRAALRPLQAELGLRP